MLVKHTVKEGILPIKLSLNIFLVFAWQHMFLIMLLDLSFAAFRSLPFFGLPPSLQVLRNLEGNLIWKARNVLLFNLVGCFGQICEST